MLSLVVVVAMGAAWWWSVRRALRDHEMLPFVRYRCHGCAAPCCSKAATAFRLPAPSLCASCAGSQAPRPTQFDDCMTFPSRSPPATPINPTHPTPRRATHIFVRVQERVLGPVFTAVLFSLIFMTIIPGVQNNCMASADAQVGLALPLPILACGRGRRAA